MVFFNAKKLGGNQNGRNEISINKYIDADRMDKTMIALERDLAKALLKMSGYSISVSKAEEIAHKVIGCIDFNNEAIAHKGINWLAKEIIDSYEIDDMEEI